MAGVIVVIGTLDTKHVETRFIAEQLKMQGRKALVMDVGVRGAAGVRADITRETVVQAAGADVEQVQAMRDRAGAIEIMAAGASVVLQGMAARGELSAVVAVGGSGGTFIASQAMQALPIGLPKVIVSTVVSANVRPYIGASDIVLMPSVVDMTGLNRLLQVILGNAAGAVAGMADVYDRRPARIEQQPIAATMFGVTTPAVSRASDLLRARGEEVIVFHATGAGGRAMEQLVEKGFFAAVLDITTTELADEVGGGICAAGPERLRVAAGAGLPQVISVGALDMINFGPFKTVPPRYAGRRFHRHSAVVTLMRTSPEECRTIGRIIGERLGRPVAPTSLVFPTKGLSSLSVPGGVFADPEADAELLAGIRERLDPSIVLAVRDTHVNDPELVDEMVDMLCSNVKGARQ